MITNVSPIQHLTASVLVASHLEEVYFSGKTICDTELSILSGSQADLMIGEDQDRQVYQTSDQGTRVLSGFNTQRTGLLISLKAFYGRDFWVFDSSVENSKPEGDLKKTTSSIKNQIKASMNGVYLLGSMRKTSDDITIDKGLPFLNRIPVLGFLFGVHQIIRLQRDVYICIKVLPDTSPSPEPQQRQDSVMESFKSMGQLINR
ncbi:MAG: hypothetical protein PHE96_10905 [Methylococcales bacterium]|nr:hypothetical protein [Methylococcales bacterium]